MKERGRTEAGRLVPEPKIPPNRIGKARREVQGHGVTQVGLDDKRPGSQVRPRIKGSPDVGHEQVAHRRAPFRDQGSNR